MTIWLWFLHWTGSDNVSGPFYGFWSGFGSDIGEATLLVGMITLYRQHNCHVSGCWRLGRHPVVGTPYVTCSKHHPVIHGQKVKPEHIAFAHRKATKP